MKITRAYIDEPKPLGCWLCKFSFLKHDENLYIDYACNLTGLSYHDCPLIYAPSKSVMRRLDIQMDDNADKR